MALVREEWWGGGREAGAAAARCAARAVAPARADLPPSTSPGKSTLLQVLAGHHMVPQDAVRVLGRPAFHDTALVSGGDLAYLGAAWRRDASAGGGALTADIGAGDLLAGIPGADPVRRDALVSMLGVDPAWRLHRLSDGQRRRVQIAAGLLRPFKVLLLDEVTVDMDVLARADLLNYLTNEAEERGAVVVYATHIFDGLAGWPTHLAHVAGGALARCGPVETVPELVGAPKLLPVVDAWLRAERAAARAAGTAACEGGGVAPAPVKAPSFPSRQMAFFR